MSGNIYHDQIMEWAKKANQITSLENPDCRSTASNPLCGDKVSVELEMDGETIKAMACQVKGCLLCKASSAMLAHSIRNLKFLDLEGLSLRLDEALTSPNEGTESFPEGFDIFFPVKPHKSRHSCVMLPFEAAMKAVTEYQP